VRLNAIKQFRITHRTLLTHQYQYGDLAAWSVSISAYFSIGYYRVTETPPKDIPKFKDELYSTLKESSLPDNPQHEDELREFLFDVRLSSLDDEQKSVRS